MTKKQSKKAYTCGVNWQHELVDDNANYIEVFGSLKALKKARLCYKECGIVELEIKFKKWIKPQNFLKKQK